MKYNIQVKKKHYFKNYDNIIRFISYFHQVNSIIKLNPKSILEIGIGNKTTYNYLKEIGYNIKSCDFDKNLNPDIVADVRQLPIKDNTFDVVCAFEILEHIPFNDFEKALDELKRVSKKYVVISIPHSSINFTTIIKTPIINRYNIPFLSFSICIPLHRKHKFNGEHYWEIGKKNYSYKKILKILQNKFKIINDFRPPLNKYHHYFILKKT